MGCTVQLGVGAGVTPGYGVASGAGSVSGLYWYFSGASGSVGSYFWLIRAGGLSASKSASSLSPLVMTWMGVPLGQLL